MLATKATIASNQYQERLKTKGFVNVKALATGLFVPLVEEGIFSGDILDSTFNYYFKDLLDSPAAIILGCTHFPLIKESLNLYFKNMNFTTH